MTECITCACVHTYLLHRTRRTGQANWIGKLHQTAQAHGSGVRVWLGTPAGRDPLRDHIYSCIRSTSVLLSHKVISQTYLDTGRTYMTLSVQFVNLEIIGDPV